MYERMNVSAAHIREALVVREELYVMNDQDPHHWDQAATLLENVGFNYSAQLCRDWADGLRYVQSLTEVQTSEEGQGGAEAIIIVFTVVLLCVLIFMIMGWFPFNDPVKWPW